MKSVKICGRMLPTDDRPFTLSAAAAGALQGLLHRSCAAGVLHRRCRVARLDSRQPASQTRSPVISDNEGKHRGLSHARCGGSMADTEQIGIDQ